MKTNTIYIVLSVLAFGYALALHNYDPSISPISTAVICSAIFLMCVFSMAPTIIANRRHHHNAKAIFWTNLLLGWTVIGWIISLIWAMTDPMIVLAANERNAKVEEGPPRSQNIPDMKEVYHMYGAQD